jgi:large subunit ribosomal protein L23
MDKFLIERPVISEKATLGSSFGQYVFRVLPNATKPEVKKAVSAIYNVHVERVRIISVKPKQRRLGRSIGVKSGYKKAVVTLREGEKLDILPHS